MTFKPLAGLIALLAIGFCALAAPQASAQGGREDVFAVSGVHVEQTAANAAAAQEAAFALARRVAFDRLVRRLTQPAEMASRAPLAPDPIALEALVVSVDVAEERRSATRYIGRLTVRFDPAGVRDMLRAQGLSVVEQRAPPMLAVAVASPDLAPETAALWRDVWNQGGFRGELAPLAVAPEALQGAPDWRAAQPFAQAAGAASALYATLRIQNGTAAATLVEVSGDARRERGEVSARIAGEDSAALRSALSALAEQTSAQIQGEWKSSLAVGTGGGRARISASALYASQREWERIKQALEGAAQASISDIRIEAVGSDGALVSFSFVGNRNQLAAELGRRGVRLEDSAMGPVLRIASGN